jgi:hypothetical protein
MTTTFLKPGRLALPFVFAVVTLVGAAPSQAATITVAPGASVAGYLPLALFSVAPIGGVGDDTVTNFAVAAYLFAGESWTSVGMSSNGFLIVGGGPGGAAPVNQNLPDSTAPNNVLAPFWTDLDPSAGGALRIGVLTDGVDSWIVADWENVPNRSDNSILNSFQVWIGINGVEDIAFVYGVVGAGNGGLLTVGAEDQTGTVGATYYFNGAGTLPNSRTDLRVTTDGLPVPEPGVMLLTLAGLAPAAWRAARGRTRRTS